MNDKPLSLDASLQGFCKMLHSAVEKYGNDQVDSSQCCPLGFMLKFATETHFLMILELVELNYCQVNMFIIWESEHVSISSLGIACSQKYKGKA